jgi:putative ABC transport system permease protein
LLRQSARSLLRQPGLFFALILSVALGVGSNTAVFAFVTGLVSVRSPLVGEDTRIVSVRTGLGISQGLLSGEDFAVVRNQPSIFETVTAVRETVGTIRSGTRSLMAAVATVTTDGRELFDLGVASAAVSRDARSRAFGGVERVAIDGIEYAAPATPPEWLQGLYAGRPIAAWVVVPDGWLIEEDSSGRTLAVLARLHPDVSLDAAQAHLDAIEAGRFLISSYSGLTPEAESGMRRIRILLTAAAAAVLLIACVNVAVLLLSRAARRSHEVSIRVALGVTRRTLAGALLVDAMLIVVPGTAGGVLVGLWTANLIPALLFTQDAEHLTFVPDLGSATLAVIVCASIAIACGLVPLVENRHDRPADVLRRQALGRHTGISRLQGALVVLQMAGCCALVVAAAFLADSFRSTLRTQTGRGVGDRALANVVSVAGLSRPDLGLGYFRDVEAAAGKVPGVFSTAWVARAPGSRPSWQPVTIDLPHRPTREVRAQVLPFTPGRIDEIVLPPLDGRMFGGADRAGGCRVAMLSEAAASTWFEGRAVGRWLRSRAGERFEIIGVAQEARPSRPSLPVVYLYPEQGDPASGYGVVTFDVPTGGAPRRGVVNANSVSDNYFQVMGGTLTMNATAQASSGRCRNAVVNREAADLYFAGDAIGGAVIDSFGRRHTIVGIIDEPLLRATQRSIPPAMYLDMEDGYAPEMTLVIATTDATMPFIEAARQQIGGVPGGRVGSVVRLDEHLARTSLATERIAALLIAVATVTALVLGVLGLHRAVADDLLRRQQEFATRSALGSPAWRLVPVLLRQGGRWAAAGTLIGLVIAAAAGVWLRGLTGFDETYAAWAWLAGPAVLTLGVLLASAVPAVRAIRVDPLIAMKTPG